jgi:hypothetical protein
VNERLDNNEEGSALILALILITVVGLMVAAAISFVDTSLIATPILADDRDERNIVDGAVEGAINAVRGSGTLGIENSPLPCDFPDFDATDDVNVTVTCTPQAGSGSAFDDQPAFAVLTLGTAATEGFIQSGNTQLTVDGGLYSNGKLDLSPGGAHAAMVSIGDVFVEGACLPLGALGTVLDSVGGLVECNYDPTAQAIPDTRGNDPDYPSGAANASGMAVDPTATCAGNNTVVAFSPGLYTEIPSVPSNCGGDVWWFQPGVYYFDFPDITGRHTWTPDDLSGQRVVGGTPNGWNASTNAASIADPDVAPMCDSTQNGVQFIFGGPSLLEITSQGTVELCGGTNATNHNNHKIALYGLKTEPARTSVGPTTLAQTGTPVSPGSTVERTFLAPNPAAKNIDGTVTAAALGLTNTTDEADLSLPAFADVPEGARITKVELKVRHFGLTNKFAPTVSVTLPGVTNPISTNNSNLSKNAATSCLAVTSCVDTWDITSNFTGELGYDKLNGLTARYHVRNTDNIANSVSFDGMELSVTYVPVGFEKHRCPTSVSNCSIITSTVNQNLFFHGTVYVPSAGLNLKVHNKDTTIFDRGIIARTISANISSSSKQEDSPFQIPRGTTGRSVLFVAKVDGVDKLRALVTYQDFNTVGGASSAFAGYKVTVEKWSVIR